MPLSHRGRMMGGGELSGGGGSTFDPASVAGMLCWYDFSDITTLFQTTDTLTPVVSNGDKIGRVADKSGNNRYLIRGTSDTYRPNYATNTQNGLSVATPNVTVNQTLLVSGVSWSNAQPVTIFVVGKVSSAVTTTETFLDGIGRVIVRKDGSNFTVYSGSLKTVKVADTNPHVICFVVNGASSDYFMDGGSDLLADNPGVDAVNQPKLFDYTSIDSVTLRTGGWIGEVLYYSGALSSTDRQNIQNHLGTKWGISII